MQNLEIISVNFWQILISLCNLLIIFLILKKFLYKPVQKVIAQRQAQIDAEYQKADEAVQKAEADRAQWEQTLATAQARADEIVNTAKTNATRRSEAMLSLARDKADIMVRQAQEDVDREYKKAQAQIKHEIADVSVLLTEKLLDREIRDDDHRELIDSFIETMGDES